MVRKRKRKSKKSKAPDLTAEAKLRELGYKKIAGIDEAGRGAWAGPLIAGAVILEERRLYLIRDSKILTRKERLSLERKIKKRARAYGLGIVEVKEINRRGMAWASHEVMRRALADLKIRKVNSLGRKYQRKIKPDFLLIDHLKLKHSGVPQNSITRGDKKSLSIAAASILAKTERDRMMRKLHKENTEVRAFRFHQNFGYGTALHRKILKKLGPSPFHRKWRPVRQLANNLKKLKLEL